jgi:hypothetical protein
VYNKEDCWSNRHTQAERDKSRKKLDDRITQYILDYKGEDIEQPPDKLIEALIIDFDSDTQEEVVLEAFLTIYRSFTDNQAFDITTTLADRSFIYLIAPAKPPANTPIKPATDKDLFAYITTERYNSKQFYGVIINIGASKMFTIGYGQYLAYRNTVIDGTDIDTL